MATATAMYSDEFDSLEHCVAQLRERFERKYLAEGRDIDTGETFRGGRFPKFLFRGESRCYSVSRPSLWRLRDGAASFAREVVKVTDFAHRYTAKRLVLPYIEDLDHFTSLEWMAVSATYEALAFCQHYGLPTAFVDFTSSLRVAASFASAGDPGSGDSWGRIAVLDCEQARLASQLIDLRFFSATRAERQRGFALYVPGHADICHPGNAARLGVHWFRFRRDSAAESRWRRGFGSLLRTDNDRLAGWLRHAISMYVRETGPITTATAEYLLDRIPMAPLVARRGTKRGWFSFQPPRTIPFERDEERARSLRDWVAPRSAGGRRARLYRPIPGEPLVRFTGT